MRSRLKTECEDPADPYSYEVNPLHLSEYDDAASYMSDGLIQIPENYCEPDAGKESMAAINFNGVAVNMCKLEIPSGGAASFAEPLLRDENRKRLKRKSGEMDDENGAVVGSTNERTQGTAASFAERHLDDDHHFLMSLHPYMADLNATQKLRLRMKIQKLVYKELYKDDTDLEEKL